MNTHDKADALFGLSATDYVREAFGVLAPLVLEWLLKRHVTHAPEGAAHALPGSAFFKAWVLQELRDNKPQVMELCSAAYDRGLAALDANWPA